MICPGCQCQITFVDGLKSMHPTRVRCSKCRTLFRITAPGQTLFLGGMVVLFLIAAAVLGDVFATDLWSGLIGIFCLVLLLIFLEFLTYWYNSAHGRLHKVEG